MAVGDPGVGEAGRVEHPHVHVAEWSADVGEHVERVAEAVPAGVGDERPVGRGDLLDGDLSGEMVDALADAEDDVGRRERGQQAGRDRECDAPLGGERVGTDHSQRDDERHRP